MNKMLNGVDGMIYEEKNISELLKLSMDTQDLEDLCICVELEDGVLPFCFIRFETPQYLVIDNTDELGQEKVVIVPKKSIVTVSVVYQDDIDSIFETDGFDEKEKRLYQ